MKALPAANLVNHRVVGAASRLMDPDVSRLQQLRMSKRVWTAFHKDPGSVSLDVDAVRIVDPNYLYAF